MTADNYFGPWAEVQVTVLVTLRVRTKRCESYDNDHVAFRALDEVREEAERLALGAPIIPKIDGPGWQVQWVKTTANQE